MSDQVENHVFKIDNCLEVGYPAYTYELAQGRLERDWPRSKYEYVGIRELRTLENRSKPKHDLTRPVVHPSVLAQKQAERKSVKAAKPFKGGHADAATMAEIENSIVDAYGAH